MGLDQEMCQEYVAEAEEYLQQFEPALLYLESNPGDTTLIDECFRNIHSLKGAAGYMGLKNTSSLAHNMEELLDGVRSGDLSINEDVISVLFAGIDRLRLLVKDVAKNGQEAHEISDVVRQLVDVRSSLTRCDMAQEGLDEDKRDEGPHADKGQVASPQDDDTETTLISLYKEQMDELVGRLDKVLSGENIVRDRVSSVLKEIRRLAHYIGADDFLERIHKAEDIVSEAPEELSGKMGQSLRERLLGLIRYGGIESPEGPKTLTSNETSVRADSDISNIEDMEEEDQELYRIFLDFVGEQCIPLARVPDKLTSGWIDKCQEAVRKIRSSANYMDYKGLVSLLDEWEERLTEVLSTSQANGDFDAASLRELWTQMLDILPGLEAIYREKSANIVDSDEITDGDLPEDVEDETGSVDPGSIVEDALDKFFAGVESEPASASSPADMSSDVSDVSNVDISGKQLEDEKDNEPDLPPKAVPIESIAAASVPEKHIPEPAGPDLDITSVSHTVRVDLDKLEDLMDGVGELVVLRAGLDRVSTQLKSVYHRLVDRGILKPADSRPVRSLIYTLAEQTEGLFRAVHNLQDIVMRLRMLPLGQSFGRYHRLVRDLSHRLNKEVRLVTSGEDTSLDKRVLEEIMEPLAHIMRNAVDHGIESPDMRRKLGKDPVGTVSISAYQEGNYVYISIEDDGKGLDRDALLAKAVTMGLISRQEAVSIEPDQVWGLIFAPGMSTAVEVSETSGRGVGLDVVKRSIERLGGEITVESEFGRGTRFLLKIPLTLVIIQALIVRVGQQMMAIAMSSVEETIRLPVSKVTTVEGFDLVPIRQDTVPLIRLDKVFHFPGPVNDDSSPKKNIFAAVVKKGDLRVALAVDALAGQQEIVIKPLSDYITDQPGFSGATLLADGSIALVIDISAVLERAASFRKIEQKKWRDSLVNQDVVDTNLSMT